MEFIDNLRNKPEQTKKAIIWAIVIIIGLLALILWGLRAYNLVIGLNKAKVSDELNINKLQEILNKEK